MSNKSRTITYKKGIVPALGDLLQLFEKSGYFPIKDRKDTPRILKMFANANLIVTAWDREKLIGVSRCISDFCYCCYLSDLAVHDDYKGQGIGRRLVELSKEIAGQQYKLILHSNQDAEGFYRRIGMDRADSVYVIPRSY